jgi:hypothetical protein
MLYIEQLVITAHEAQQMQQAGKQVEDGHKQGHCGHDVISFAALDDIAGFIQNEAGHQQDENGRNCQ